MSVSSSDFYKIEKDALENGTDESVKRLADWYEQYGKQYWNGEWYYGKYNGSEYRLVPIYAGGIGDDGEEANDYYIIDWELIRY